MRAGAMSPVGVGVTPEELRAFRVAHQLRQEDLAELLGVKRVTIIRWEDRTVRIPQYLSLALECLERLYDIDSEREGARRITTGRTGQQTERTSAGSEPADVPTATNGETP